MRRPLVLMPLGPAHAVRGREQERGPARTRWRAQHLAQPGPGRFPPLETERAKALRPGDGFLLRLISGGRHPLVKRSDQEISAHFRGPIPGMARSPVDHLPAGRGRLSFLVIHHALCIQAILIGKVEAEAADGVLDIEQVLEFERNRLGTADQQEVVGHLGRRHGTRVDPVPLEPVFHVLARPVFQGLAAISEHLGAAMRDQWFQGAERLGGCLGGDNDTPAGTRDVGRIDVDRQATERPRKQALDPLQPSRLLAIRGRPDQPGDRFRRHRRDKILAGHAIDAVEKELVLAHGGPR